MTTYKQGQDWQKDKNENVWLKLRVSELEAEVEELHQEIRLMQETADNNMEVLDEIIENIPTEGFIREKYQGGVTFMHNPMHDPSGNEY